MFNKIVTVTSWWGYLDLTPLLFIAANNLLCCNLQFLKTPTHLSALCQ